MQVMNHVLLGRYNYVATKINYESNELTLLK